MTQVSNGSSASPEASPANHPDDHRQVSCHQPKLLVSGHCSLFTQQMYSIHPHNVPPPVDFTGYSSNSVSLPHHPPPAPRVLENERMIAPYPRPSSNSPRSVSLESPHGVSKKRSITEASTDDSSHMVANGTSMPKNGIKLPAIASAAASQAAGMPARLSSISSLLNHAADPLEDSRLDPSLAALSRQHRQQQQQQQQENRSQSRSPSLHPPANSQDSGESERVKAERRARLQREAEDMREALRVKERELAQFQ